jgi:carbon-monoxide dehydrogenase medium subunit
LADFHRGVRKIDLAPNEMVTGLRVRAMKPSERGIFVKLGLRRAQAISVVHLAIVVDLEGAVVRSASIALGSVAPTIVNATGAETFLVGKALNSDVIAEAARMVAAAPRPIDDLRGTARYRTEQLRVLTSRALQAIADNRQSEQWPADPVTLGGHGLRRTHPQLIDLGPVDTITALVNGQSITAAGAADRTLLDWLRDQAGPAGATSLTGTKEGCAEGECGACTVLLNGMAVMSCLVPAGRASGAEVVTIEGLGPDGRLHPLQQAFLDQGAVQCGFCIPGFLVSGASLLAERPRPTDAEIRTGLSGNLCRCTGYYRIIAAVHQAAASTS